MAMQRLFVDALWASLAMTGVSYAHVVNVYDNRLQPRHEITEKCSPTFTVTKTEREVCTVTVKEIVTVREYLTVTTTEGLTLTVTKTEGETYTVAPTETFTTTYSSAVTPSDTFTTASTSAVTNTPSPSVTASESASAPSSPASTPTGCPVPPSCGNLGFNWAYYNNSARNSDATYSSFHPDTYKNVEPLYVNTTRYVGGLYGTVGSVSAAGPIYGSPENLRYDYFALNHHGYLYACEAGTYNVDIPYANDAVYLWLGAKAYAGWTDENADAKALYNQPDHIAGKASFTFSIPAASYIPIRFFYGQAQYGGGFSFNVTTPSGEVIVSNTDTSSPYVVQYSCDGITAPRYPPFGGEI